MNHTDTKSVSVINLISQLSHLGRVDTLYRDLYLNRARRYLVRELPPEAYQDLQKKQDKLNGLPNQIRNAMTHGDWQKVRDLSGQYQSLQEILARRRNLKEVAEKIYGVTATPIDPFSPGMHKLAGYSARDLEKLRSDAIETLRAVSEGDTEQKGFYQQRRRVFTELQIKTNGRSPYQDGLTTNLLEEEAAEALKAGNMAKLEFLADKMLRNPGSTEQPPTPTELLEGAHPPAAHFHYQFSPEVLRKAAALGLEPYSAPSRTREYAPYCRFAWHPTYSELRNEKSSQNVLQVPDLHLPANLPNALKNRIQLFAIHPFINSCGVRFLPSMVAEDVLIESFPEPDSDSDLKPSALLEALGLRRRTQLSREQIENILQEKGNQLLEDVLGLDAEHFKLVCIPPDLHLRIGQELGWGGKKIWTHFDGYMIMADGSRRALAGGDVRYGGIYDLLGISPNYDSERIIARFAVVQRRRLAVWQVPPQ